MTTPGDLAIIRSRDSDTPELIQAMRTDDREWPWVTPHGDRYALNAVEVVAVLTGDLLSRWFQFLQEQTSHGPLPDDPRFPDDEVDTDDVNAAAKLEAAEDRLEALTKAADVLNPDVGGGLRFTRSPERARDMLAIESAKWVLRG